jgi:hypothetical protein
MGQQVASRIAKEFAVHQDRRRRGRFAGWTSTTNAPSKSKKRRGVDVEDRGMAAVDVA